MMKISKSENQNKRQDFEHHDLNNIVLVYLRSFHIYLDYMYFLQKNFSINLVSEIFIFLLSRHVCKSHANC